MAKPYGLSHAGEGDSYANRRLVAIELTAPADLPNTNDINSFTTPAGINDTSADAIMMATKSMMDPHFLNFRSGCVDHSSHW
ncbi:hypothetical protein GCM10023115_24460 [Pontixanthobacter gangjinensis]